MHLDVNSASDHSLPDLTYLLNLSFEFYLVPVSFNLTQFLTMLRKDSIDLVASRVLLADGEPAGIGLIARRGWTSRLAAMGLAKKIRGQGAGKWFMDQLIQEARVRGDHELVLEVIEQNEYAVRLYRSCGFQSVRRLIGLTCERPVYNGRSVLETVDLREAGRLITRYGLPDLPWQLAGETIAHLNPPVCAYRKGRAYAVISNPAVDQVVIWSLLVEPAARGKYLGIDMLKSVMAKHPGKTWHAPAIFPEEFGHLFERAGFEREELSQWQMRLEL